MKLKQRAVTNNFLTVDPGSRENGGTGIAYFSKTQVKPVLTKQLTGKGKDWSSRADNVLFQYRTFLEHNTSLYVLYDIYIERPQYFNTFKGQVTAESDSLFKLIYLYGRIWEATLHTKNNPIFVKIAHWKGQLNKSQVSNRVEKICGKKYSGDVCDAVGIGLYLKGLF